MASSAIVTQSTQDKQKRLPSTGVISLPLFSGLFIAQWLTGGGVSSEKRIPTIKYLTSWA